MHRQDTRPARRDDPIMALINWLKIAFGIKVVPRRYHVPRPPCLVVIAGNVRTAELWLRQQELHHQGLSRVRLVTPDRPERLRGMGGPIDLVWINPSDLFAHPKMTELANYVAMLRSLGHFTSETEEWV